MTKHQLKEYCDAEFENIETVLSELFAVVKPKKPKYSTAELAAVATFVHNYYNGVENILKRILLYRHIKTGNSPTWHKDLLKISKNKAIISKQLHDILANYLSFRHFFVHAYSFTLNWEELKPLVRNIRKTLKRFKSEVHTYFEKLK